jgi:hypothetical protein
MTNRDKIKNRVRVIWPFAVAAQSSVTKTPNSSKRIIYDAPTEDEAWKELWNWIQDAVSSYVR